MTVADGGGGGFPIVAWGRIIAGGFNTASNSVRIARQTRRILQGQMQAARDMSARLPTLNFGPSPADNPPIPQPGPTGYAVGSLFYGSKGPKRRRRKVPKRQLPQEDEWGGYPGGPLCGTDAQCEEWDRAHGVVDPDRIIKRPDSYQTRYPLPDLIPPPVAVPLPTTPGPIMGPILEGLTRALRAYPYLILARPTPTAVNDVIVDWYDYQRTDIDIQPQTQPEPAPRGPPRRPRVGTRPATVEPIYADKPIGGYRGPIPEPRPEVAPRPGVLDQPMPAPMPTPGQLPKPAAIPKPPLTLPKVPTWLVPLVAPFLPLSLPSPSPLRSPRAYPSPVSPPSSGPLTPPQTSPLAFGSPYPQPNASDPCERTRTKNRRKKSCSNPVVSRRTRSKGSVTYSIITRRIECPGSSRRKRRSPRVR